jgi:hypothetical protein
MIIFTHVIIIGNNMHTRTAYQPFPLLIPHNIELYGNFQCYSFRYMLSRKLGQYLVHNSPHHNTDNMTTHVHMHTQ